MTTLRQWWPRWRRRDEPCARCACIEAMIAQLGKTPEWVTERDTTAPAPAAGTSKLDRLPRCAECNGRDFALETVLRFIVTRECVAREAEIARKDVQLCTLRGELESLTRSGAQAKAIAVNWSRPAQGAH